MKLDVSCMRYLSKEDYRVLEAVEMGMRNHELVPVPLIASIAKLRHGGLHKFMSTLLRYKLIAHSNSQYNGYRLSYMGYDILALHTLLSRGIIVSVGSQIGVGKESDIFEAEDENGNEIVLKIHRLGRTSFRSVRRNRDYMQGKHKASWLYMSRLAALKEFAFMKALYANGFPTPVPFDQNRHVVAMSRVHGFPMSQIKTGRMEAADVVYKTCIMLLRRLAEHGLVHCDFNEFNLMVDTDYHVTLIDFPQMVSTLHPNAEELFHRDQSGLQKFFAMKMGYFPPEELTIHLSDVTVTTDLDELVKASGFAGEDNDDFGLVEATLDDEVENGGEDGQDGEEESELEGQEEVREDNDPEASCADGNVTANPEGSEEEEENSVCEKASSHVAAAAVPSATKQHIHLKIEKDLKHHHGKGSTKVRNATKKRNKYGSIDRSERIGYF